MNERCNWKSTKEEQMKFCGLHELATNPDVISRLRVLDMWNITAWWKPFTDSCPSLLRYGCTEIMTSILLSVHCEVGYMWYKRQNVKMSKWYLLLIVWCVLTIKIGETCRNWGRRLSSRTWNCLLTPFFPLWPAARYALCLHPSLFLIELDCKLFDLLYEYVICAETLRERIRLLRIQADFIHWAEHF